ncbi:type 1 glutamine amidotransferase [Mongoliibacter ruber]|uniref:GMP synthase-like glutamine amidotransferase n=1 Tax=Mongoliibacter ruber TaxID=1750599 RepID=A0A2T0WK02_9BACT|nr:GMP synthase [Mongoliibacter ruber]PRY87026.1 GMP synthase-like glutamine amidotransferase [Mongoliibacter ruber]
MQEKIKVAILDMYDGEPNQGMRCIHDIINRFSEDLTFNVYDVRGKADLPDMQEYNLYVATGGPGNPLEGDGNWEVKFSQFLDQLWEWNLTSERKKYILFICHSYQMAVKHFGLAEITKRKSTSFGVMTIHKTDAGMGDPLFEGLENPFWAVDSRDYQVIKPHLKKFRTMGAKMIAMEKIRSHVEYERAIMAVRFSPEMVGTQFHPEADPVSFLNHLKKKEIRDKLVESKGKAKYRTMLERLVDENTIYKTNETLIPNFLQQSIAKIRQEQGVLLT